MKIKLTAHLDSINEIFDIDDDLTEDKISEYFWSYIVENVVWDWDQVDEE